MVDWIKKHWVGELITLLFVLVGFLAKDAWNTNLDLLELKDSNARLAFYLEGQASAQQKENLRFIHITEGPRPVLTAEVVD